jgi:hypothetical protein
MSLLVVSGRRTRIDGCAEASILEDNTQMIIRRCHYEFRRLLPACLPLYKNWPKSASVAGVSAAEETCRGIVSGT